MSIKCDDLQALMDVIRQEHEKSRRETLSAVKVMIAEHELAEADKLKDMLTKALSESITESHEEEHKFIKTWMGRMDSMGDGFFNSIGKALATLVFLGFAAAALASMGKA